MYINKIQISIKRKLKYKFRYSRKTNTKGSNQYFINKEIRRIKSKIEKLEQEINNLETKYQM